MKSIAFDEENGKQISARIQEFFKRYQLSEILRKSNAYKQQGVSVMAIMSYLFCLVFRNRSMFLDMQSGKAPVFRKEPYTVSKMPRTSTGCALQRCSPPRSLKQRWSL